MAEIVKLQRPITYNGVQIVDIDVSALEDLTGMDLMRISRLIEKKNQTPSQASLLLPEADPETLMYYVAEACGIPVDILMKLSAKDFMAVKRAASAYFLGGDEGDEVVPSVVSENDGK